MSSKFNVLLHGSAADAANIIGNDLVSSEEIRAALANALNRIDNLERTQRRHDESHTAQFLKTKGLQERMASITYSKLKSGPRCDDCECLAVYDDIGKTCRECGRGVIKVAQ